MEQARAQLDTFRNALLAESTAQVDEEELAAASSSSSTCAVDSASSAFRNVSSCARACSIVSSRSEERRVGKDGSDRWSAGHGEQKHERAGATTQLTGL